MRTGPALAAEPAPVDVARAPEPVTLVLVCAWCGQPIGRAAAASRRIVSHGMCRPCLEEMLAADGRAFAATGAAAAAR